MSDDLNNNISESKKQYRLTATIATFVDDYAIGWAFCIPEHFKLALDIEMSNRTKTEMGMQYSYAIETQGFRFKFNVGDVIHSNKLAYEDWDKFIINNDSITLQVTNIENNKLCVEIYKYNIGKANLYKTLKLSQIEFVDFLKTGIYFHKKENDSDTTNFISILNDKEIVKKSKNITNSQESMIFDYDDSPSISTTIHNDKNMDTLIGICQGLVADDKINNNEFECLYNWILSNPTDNQIFKKIAIAVNEFSHDYSIEKSEKLVTQIREIIGEKSEFGEMAKPIQILDHDAKIIFQNKTFMLTGTFLHFSRQEYKDKVINFGGDITDSKYVSKNIDYLVIGSYVADAWKHQSYGRKIEQAIELKAKYKSCKLKIISEDLLFKALTS